LQKQAIEVVTNTDSPGFYSHLFVVPKQGGKWRPVIDLSVLNTFIEAPHFRMETARSVRQSVKKGEFAVSLDLSDAYLHIPMHRASQKYLRFAIDGVVYAFRALPFGLNLSPWVFTRIMDTVVASVRQNTESEVSNYLDDILQKNMQAQVLAADLNVLRNRLEELGFLVNLLKSDTIPAQNFVHLGMNFQTALGIVKLTEKRRDALIQAVQSLRRARTTTPREVTKVIGLCSAAAELIPLGRLTVRPLQWALADSWTQSLQSWDMVISVSNDLRAALLPWMNVDWLMLGVPLEIPIPEISMCTDASLGGWGAHLLPNFHTCAGIWSEEEKQRHINELELLAVLRALTHWRVSLSHQAVMLLSDNSTVVAYIRNQGGTHSRSLCQLTVEVLQLCAASDIHLLVRHIPGRLNVLADGLSRTQVLPTEWTLHTEIFRLIHGVFPSMEIDLFATRLNRKLEKFVSPVPDPLAIAVDALSLDWEGKDLYAFPPFPLILKVLQRLSLFPCTMTLIAPFRWNRSWITPLLNRLIAPPWKLPVRPDLLYQPDSSVPVLYPDIESLNLHAFRLSGGHCNAGNLQVRQWIESVRPGDQTL
jgi:hypothetical protein